MDPKLAVALYFIITFFYLFFPFRKKKRKEFRGLVSYEKFNHLIQASSFFVTDRENEAPSGGVIYSGSYG